MAYSIYAYLETKALSSADPYLQNYFAEHPWTRNTVTGHESSTGGQYLFVYIKPRFSGYGIEKIKPFMNSMEVMVKEAALVMITADDGKDLPSLLKANGYGELLAYIDSPWGESRKGT